MRTAAARPIEACLLDLFQHFGIERAHIAAGGPPPLKDWHSLATLHPQRVASLTLGRVANYWKCARKTSRRLGIDRKTSLPRPEIV
jgi:hypothetical protein